MRFRRRSGSGEPTVGPEGSPADGQVDPLVAMAIEEAAALGHRVEGYDAETRSLTVQGLGEVALGQAIDRSQGLTEAQQRPKMRSAITRAIRRAPSVVDERYAGLAEDLLGPLQRNQTALKLNPGAPGPLQAIGRLERAAGVDGWERSIAAAADAYCRWADERGRAEDRLGVASMCRLVGDHDRARTEAGRAASMVDTTWREPTYNPALAVLGAALAIAGRRTELAELAELEGQPRLGPLWWGVCRAAGAVDHGDRSAASLALTDLVSAAAAEPIEWDAPEPSVRDLVEIVSGWIDGLD